jgi:hypothetical protein
MGISVQCFVLCRSVTKDQDTRVLSIDHLFDQVSAKLLPTQQRCVLHVRFVIPDRSKCTVAITLESPMQVKGVVLEPISTNPNPNGLVQLTCELKDLLLPHEGIYTFRLLVDQKPCSEYYLTVVKRRPRSAAPEPPFTSTE